MEIKNLFEKILGLCYEISTTTVADVFFHYSSHCNSYDIYYYKNRWDKNTKSADPIYVTLNEEITEKNLLDTTKKLKELKREVSVLLKH